MEETLLTAAVSFGRSLIGLIIRPYEAARRIVERGSPWELLFLGIPMAVYFAVASLVKTAAFRPFLLTKQFVLLALAVGVSFVVTTALFWGVSRLFTREGKLKGFVLCWGYSLIPTLLWFLATSLLYVILPPPRTTGTLGVLFSAVFLIFSATLLFWKITIGYLAIRFGMRLDLFKIVGVAAIVLPLLAFYSYGMYRVGIFRVPFL